MKTRTPIEAIKQQCLDCCEGSADGVRICNVVKCALHPFRMGVKKNKRITNCHDKRKAF